MNNAIKRETRTMATKDEAIILLEAKKDYKERGNTTIKCPRCGKAIECRYGESGSSVYCIDEKCIIVNIRGI